MVAGAAIGAGMFSLPVISAGMWFPWTVVCLLIIWLLSYFAALIILETNLHYAPGASFDTFVSDTLGTSWNILSRISLIFLLYILLYAYFSAGGSIVAHTLTSTFGLKVELSPNLMSIFFGSVFGICVFVGATLVGRLSVILICGMVLTFFFSTTGLIAHVEIAKLFNYGDSTNKIYFSFIWAGLPYFITSFGYASLVPSLVKYYNGNSIKVRKCLLYGSLIVLAFYSLWIFVVFGNIYRSDFATTIGENRNIDNLIRALEGVSDTSTMTYLLNLFTGFAIISSFIGAGLCLFDYLADLFKLENNTRGRLIGAGMTFIPPGIFSFLYPHGFVLAIGYAGLTMYFGYFLIPVLMVWRNRKRFPDSEYRLGGGSVVLVLILALSTVISICHILAMAGILPVYP